MDGRWLIQFGSCGVPRDPNGTDYRRQPEQMVASGTGFVLLRSWTSAYGPQTPRLWLYAESWAACVLGYFRACSPPAPDPSPLPTPKQPALSGRHQLSVRNSPLLEVPPVMI